MNSDSLLTLLSPKIYSLTKILGIPIAIVLLIIFTILFFKCIDTIRVFKARVLGIFAFFGNAPTKYFIANDIKARLGRTLTSSEYKDCFDLFDIKVKWVDKSTSREAFIAKYKIVVKLENSKNQNKNFAIATYLTIKEGFLSNEKLYLDYPIRNAIELITAKEIIKKEKGSAAVDVFNHEILDPSLEKSNAVRLIYPIILRLQFAGFLRNIFYLELRTLKNRYYPELIDNMEIREDLSMFLSFLDEIASRGRGEEINLDYCGKFIQVKIVLMAKRETLRQGTGPYIEAIRIGIDNGFNNFYIIAYKHCLISIEKVAKEAVKFGCAKLDDFGVYNGRISGYDQQLRCIHLVGNAHESNQLEFDDFKLL